jgi:hypothetical protein
MKKKFVKDVISPLMQQISNASAQYAASNAAFEASKASLNVLKETSNDDDYDFINDDDYNDDNI